MNVVVCSGASGPHLELLDISAPTFSHYADRNRFDLHIDRNLGGERPPSWYKIPLLKELLADYDAAIWIDADAKVVAHHRNILDDADPSRPLWMVLHRAGDVMLPNAGVMVAYSDPLLLDFFDAAWGQTQYVDHPWWEQAAMLHLLGYSIDRPGGLASPGPATRWTPLVGWLGTEWNSMPHDPHPHPYIRHFSGMPFLSRLEGMRAA